MPENTMRIESSARVRARHALFVHDAADAPPGRGDALPFQGGLDLPGAVAFAAVAPDRAYVAGDRIHTLRPEMPGHPVTGGSGTPSIPHRDDIGRRWPVSRLLSGTTLILIALYRSSCTLVHSPLKYRGGGCGEKNVPKR